MKTPQHDAYPGLDSLRALASISVLATHTCFWTGQYGKGLLGAASSRLDIGVAFFFVLSGFLLGRPFLAAMADRRTPPGTGRYFWKRALRILPLYWIVAIVALVVLPENADAGWREWIETLTLTNLYFEGPLPAGLTQMWSLATEVAFYLLLPLLMLAIARFACRRGWNRSAIMVTLAILACLNIAWLISAAPQRNGAGQWLPAYLSWFGVGLFFAVLTIEKKRETSPRIVGVFTELAHNPATCWVMALALFAVSTTPIAGPTLLIPPTYGEAVTKNLLYALIAGLIVLPSILGPRAGTRYSDFLGTPLLRHIGLISYGIFCVHLLIIHLVADWRDIPLFQGHGWELFFLTLALSLIASELLYRVVEKPLMRLRNFRSGSSKTRAAATASDTTTAS